LSLGPVIHVASYCSLADCITEFKGAFPRLLVESQDTLVIEMGVLTCALNLFYVFMCLFVRVLGS
jgi:hypothetical protein